MRANGAHQPPAKRKERRRLGARVMNAGDRDLRLSRREAPQFGRTLAVFIQSPTNNRPSTSRLRAIVALYPIDWPPRAR